MGGQAASANAPRTRALAKSDELFLSESFLVLAIVTTLKGLLELHRGGRGAGGKGGPQGTGEGRSPQALVEAQPKSEAEKLAHSQLKCIDSGRCISYSYALRWSD